MYVCVCLWEREGEKEREREWKDTNHNVVPWMVRLWVIFSLIYFSIQICINFINRGKISKSSTSTIYRKEYAINFTKIRLLSSNMTALKGKENTYYIYILQNAIQKSISLSNCPAPQKEFCKSRELRAGAFYWGRGEYQCVRLSQPGLITLLRSRDSDKWNLIWISVYIVISYTCCCTYLPSTGVNSQV